ncbi:DNA cytosine methyltransferase [Qipengyuania sp. SS22]|uniref:DNA cytosine methyltransferase n=1 Tax=Qipengyuania sp. SS22 TaxID=2979461 RepID=UPI0021E534EE|nr:DNA cytosine methyltransferase [Qipengyuania sp. SS22]UYH55997.1 DNA cytosine methyltransferase [Qipengyuania sp. SS22]
MSARPEVVDLFCGVGALSHGLKLAGCRILAGYDTDERCKHAFETNNGGEFVKRDVGKMSAYEIMGRYSGDAPSVLAGCAPCQPFSTYKQRYAEDPQWGLVRKFAELAAEVQPDFVTMENVPSLLRYKDGSVFRMFKDILNEAGYPLRVTVAKCELFGVPQKRRRLVVVAARGRKIGPLIPAENVGRTVREAIGHLPPIEAGAKHANDPLHTSSSLSDLNMRRMKAAKPGGTWRDWPEDLRADCHRRASGKTYPGVYARMMWDEPAPTMTTQCFGFGNGRFGHPEQDRAISLREAALLQSFPEGYEFVPTNEKPSMKEVGRWIGNAVPVELGRAIGNTILVGL